MYQLRGFLGRFEANENLFVCQFLKVSTFSDSLKTILHAFNPHPQKSSSDKGNSKITTNTTAYVRIGY